MDLSAAGRRAGHPDPDQAWRGRRGRDSGHTGGGHTTPIVLRLDEAIADVLAGDADYWHVSVNGERCVRQAAGGEHRIERYPGRRESGRVSALLVAESSDEDPDVVVYVEVKLPRLCGTPHSRSYAEFGTMRSNPGFRLLKHL